MTTAPDGVDLASTAAIVEIQQLAARYSLAVDSRDLDLLVSLFVPDVRVGGGATGREALRRWYGDLLATVGPSIHFLGQHVVDLGADAPDGGTATGIVSCREEIQQPDTGTWQIGMIQYRDTYRRVDGRWLFQRRRVARWYRTDEQGRPQALPPDGSRDGGTLEAALPGAFPTWAPFWAARQAEAEAGA